MNTRILHIHGDGESEAMEGFRRAVKGGVDPIELWEESDASKSTVVFDDGSFCYRAYKFGDTDPRLLRLIDHSVNTEQSSIIRIGV